MADHEVDLVVAGCGPVGVALALAAARRGLTVLAVDRATEIYDLPRAIVLDEEVLQILRDLGVEVDDITTPLCGAEFVRADGSRVTGVDVPNGLVLASGLPPAVTFEQPVLEARLREHARDAGVQFALGTELTTFATDDDGLAVRLQSLDGTAPMTVRAGWLVGADGARSTVRKLAGIAFVDQGFDQRWLVVDTWLRRDVGLPSLVQQICDPARRVTFVPGHDRRRRWEFQLADDECLDGQVAPAWVWSLLAPWVRPDDVELTRAVVYRFHALVAERFHGAPDPATSRVLLAGDAAHQMPPFNGQGLCSGLRDVANLSWKLALVVRGEAAPELLDTYDLERRPHAAAQVVHAADAGKLIDAIAGVTDHGTVEELLDAGYGAGRPFPRIEHGLVTGDDRLVGRPAPMPTLAAGRLDLQLGDRFGLLATTDPRALVTSEVAGRWDAVGARWLTIGDEPWLAHLVADGRIAVLRPDRTVAAVAAPTDLAAVTEALLWWSP